MPGWFRKPLTRGEIFGYFAFLAGFVLFEVHGPRDGLLQLAIVIMAIGTVIAARASSPPSN